MALEDLTPEVREEEILNGSDIEPATRLEYFMKKAANEVPKPTAEDEGKNIVVDNGDYVLTRPVFERNNETSYGIQAVVPSTGGAHVNTASGAMAFAGGNGSTASGIASFAYGQTQSSQNCVASATGSVSMGSGNQATGIGSVAMGQLTQAIAGQSTAFGNKTVSNGRACFVAGQSNVIDENPVDTDHGVGARKYIFILGNGNSAGDVRSNALTVDWDGNIGVSGNLVLGMGTADEVTLTPVILKNLLNLLSN